MPTAAEVFSGALADKPHQKDRLREDVQVTDAQLLDLGQGYEESAGSPRSTP